MLLLNLAVQDLADVSARIFPLWSVALPKRLW